jgi:hypothetical protein
MTFPPGWNELSTVGSVSEGELFAARDNADAVRKIREWCDRTGNESELAPGSNGVSVGYSLALSRCVREVRGLLPPVDDTT